jgi:hypothetical protein
MANTVIQLKYSNVTGTPPSLNLAEPAYSNVSNKLWIDDGTGVVAIGGKYYTTTIDAATSANTANTIVRRDTSGNFSANNVTANLNGKLVNARNIALGGDANGTVSFDASQDVTITVDLTASGVTAGYYGSTTQIPTFRVDTDGRLLNAANVSIATSLAVAGDSGSSTIDLLSETLTIVGGDGITSTAVSGNNSVIVDVDNTVIRNTGAQTITGDFTVAGNLIITGNTVTANVSSLVISDPIILLANTNPGDSIDLGFTAHYVSSGNTLHTGLVRHAATDKYYLFEDYGPHILESNILDVNDPTMKKAILVADIDNANISNLFSAISVTDGGTGFRTANTGDLIYGTGTNTLGKLIKPSSNSFLRMGSSGTPEWIDIIDVADGGTGNTAFTSNHVILGNGTGALTTVGSSIEGHLLTINSSGAPTFQHLSGGTF